MVKKMKEVLLDVPVVADNAIVWQDDTLYLLDQRVLPGKEIFIDCVDSAGTADAITAMVVRGAPAIGVTAAFGVVLAARESYQQAGASWQQAIMPLLDYLLASRPTAINLFWAIDRLKQIISTLDASDPVPVLLKEAQKIHQEDVAANKAIGDWGASLITESTGIITHCNAGALATGGYGTALGVIRSAFAQQKVQHVYADETRPWLQGARLTAWELERDNIPVSLITDGAAAARMSAGGIGWVIVGSDRIAANGDVANKIGTFGLAVVARYHGIKFMVAAPTSTIDMATATGKDIPIETRASAEVLEIAGKRVGANGVEAWNPVFDVTPAALVDAIVTEKGVILSPNREKVAKHMS